MKSQDYKIARPVHHGVRTRRPNAWLDFNLTRDLPYLKAVIFIICLYPALLMLLDAVLDALGANPVEKLMTLTGQWSLRFLMLSLALTPIRMLTGFTMINLFRRMVGLYAFFYCSLHFLVFIVLEHTAMLTLIVEAVAKSQTVQVGLIAYGLLIPLAFTSTHAIMRRLGKSWKKIHKMIHIIAVLAVFHFLLSVKADFTEPLIYAVIVLLLQSIRIIYRRRPKIAQ